MRADGPPSTEVPAHAALGAAHAALAAATRARLASGRVGRTILWLWATLVAIWFLVSFGAGLLAMLAVPVGILAMLRSEQRWASAIAARALADSFAAITLGRLALAEATLDALDGSSWLTPAARRLVWIQKGLVAVRRGDMHAALEPLGRAIDLPPARAERDASYQRTGATALRAFALASIGERDAALRDVSAVRASSSASEDALARVSLAEALVLERAGERDALRELLARDRRPLREATHPRERAVVRALERLVRTPKVTPYRVAEARDESGDEPPVETWLARIAPGLAAFAEPRRAVSGGSPAIDLQAPAPTARGLAAVQASRTTAGAPMWPLVILAFAAFGGLAWLMTGLPGPTGSFAPGGAPSPTDGSLVGLVAATLASATGVGLGSRWMSRRRDRRRLAEIRAGTGASSAADEPHAALEALALSVDDASAAQARLLLADRAEREGRWADALREAEAGLQRVATPAARRDTGLLAPDLIGLRAFALAVLGRAEEADAELGAIAQGYPHYPRALFRVRLVHLLRAGQLAEAAAHVEAFAADMPLSLREELLADLVRAVASEAGVTRAEAIRLADELSAEPATRRWVASVAPRILEAFEGDDASPVVAGPRSSVAAEQDAPVLEQDGPSASAGDSREHEGPAEELDEVAREAEAEAELAASHQGSSRASTARRTS